MNCSEYNIGHLSHYVTCIPVASPGRSQSCRNFRRHCLVSYAIHDRHLERPGDSLAVRYLHSPIPSHRRPYSRVISTANEPWIFGRCGIGWHKDERHIATCSRTSFEATGPSDPGAGRSMHCVFTFVIGRKDPSIKATRQSPKETAISSSDPPVGAWAAERDRSVDGAQLGPE